jgi:hypothetical protein
MAAKKGIKRAGLKNGNGHTKVLPKGHRRRVADGRNSWRHADRAQRVELLGFFMENGLREAIVDATPEWRGKLWDLLSTEYPDATLLGRDRNPG